jgi:hypothetical protein
MRHPPCVNFAIVGFCPDSCRLASTPDWQRWLPFVLKRPALLAPSALPEFRQATTNIRRRSEAALSLIKALQQKNGILTKNTRPSGFCTRNLKLR